MPYALERRDTLPFLGAGCSMTHHNHVFKKKKNPRNNPRPETLRKTTYFQNATSQVKIWSSHGQIISINGNNNRITFQHSLKKMSSTKRDFERPGRQSVRIVFSFTENMVKDTCTLATFTLCSIISKLTGLCCVQTTSFRNQIIWILFHLRIAM